MSGFVNKAKNAVQKKRWGDLKDLLDGVERQGFVKAKEMAELYDFLNKQYSADEDDDDADILNAIESFLYFWVNNMSDDGVAWFLKWADLFVELTDTDGEKTGRAYEGLQINVIENSGCVAPDGVDLENYWLSAAEAYVEAGSMRADDCLKKLRNRIKRDEPLKWIRYKSASSRVLDRSRRYGGASYQYLSTLKDAEALGIGLNYESKCMSLNNAAICAVLDKHGPPRTAVLQEIRAHELADTIPVSSILLKVSNNEIVTPTDVKIFSTGLAEHHNATLPDGRTVVQDAMIRHNISVVASIYKRVSLASMSTILGVSNEEDAERVVTEMITKENLKAIIDGVDRTVEFNPDESALADWEEQIAEFCGELDVLCNDIERTNMMQVS